MGHWLKHSTNKAQQAVYWCVLLALFVLIGGIVLTASVPPVSRDALTHHLALPKLYLKHGGLVELPNIPFSYYPMNLDLLYLAALAFGNDILPKFIHLVFGLLTAWLMYKYLKTRMSAVFGLMGALLWLSTPIVVRLASEVYVDLGVAFFGFASIYMLIRWVDSEFKTRHLMWSGVWCGLSLGTKYNALLIFAILCLMVPFIRSREGTKKKDFRRENIQASTIGNKQAMLPVLNATICFAVISLSVFSPWMIRNMVMKNNPIYPMFKQVFNADDKQGVEWSRTSTMVQDTSGTMTVRHLVFKESLGYMALMPLRIFYEGRDDSPRYFDGKLNPFLLVFLIVGILPVGTMTVKLRAEQHIWFWFSAIFILMAFFTAPIRIRYLVPALPAIVVLSMMGIYRSWDYIRKTDAVGFKYFYTILLSMAVIVMIGYNANYMAERIRKVQPMGYVSGKVSSDEYITKRRPEYPLIKYVNERLAPDAVLLGLFLGQRMYYFDRDITFNEGLLLNAVADSENAYDILQHLNKKKITHLMVRLDLYQNWLRMKLEPSDILKLNTFLQYHTHKIEEMNGFGLYGLDDDPIFHN